MSLVWSPGFNGVTDPDAQTYIAAVEAADGQAIEGNVAYAINDFVVGCKLDGIWDAIKASCILAGARTLSGALVPLKGTAPTNNNFVAADYNRETGLKGEVVTNKYLDSNRSNNADPQNSKHVSVYTTSTPTFVSGVTRSYIGNATSTGSTHLSFSGAVSGTISARVNASSGGSGITNVEGFIGANRNVSTSFIVRSGGVDSTVSSTSAVPSAANLLVFDGVGKTPARIAFYSIGEAIDLEKLDTRTTRLMNLLSYSLASGLPALSSMDIDAALYIGAVYRAGGTLS